jgi:hypothetical protein
VVDPQEAQSFNIKSLSHVVNRFPILKDVVNVQDVDNEWRQHALLNHNILDTDAGVYWQKNFELKNHAGMPLFPNLKLVFSLLLALPFSNASVYLVI